MSATAEASRERTAAERERPPLVAELDDVRAALESYRDGRPPPAPLERTGRETALDRLAGALDLSAFERQVLVLAAAVELDAETARLVASLQGDDPRPTFALALAALPEAHWDALAPSAPLRRWRLVDLGPGTTLATRPLRLDERVLHHLTGLPAPDERLDGVLRAGPSARPLAPSQEELARELARTVVAASAPALIALDGDDQDARLAVAAATAAQLGLAALAVRAAALPAPGPELAALARLVDREAVLVGGVPVVEAENGTDGAVGAFLDALEAPLVVLVGEGATASARRVRLGRAVPLPSPAEQRALWAEALGKAAARRLAGPVEELAQHVRLGATAVDGVARELRANAGGKDAAAVLKRLCRERARVPLDGLAARIEPAATWDDLVLPEGQAELLREIARHVRHRTQVYERWGFGERTSRGLGVTALFAGESGTGKTLAAEVLAAELELDVYRIDVATTVSKYIGETEKNLRRVFDAAEVSGAILLFDEADALFGKRGEVKDGRDRYANLEVAYLLQRMEAYRGLAILTTNLRANVDRAFLRRLRFVVQFPFPDVAQRTEIWRRVFPRATPLDGIDPERLARLPVTGGSIRAIALSAAFAAAEDGTAVTPAHLVRATQVEYAKAERPFTDAETAVIA
jgi:ATPase family associated with various cellular activities (AAA)